MKKIIFLAHDPGGYDVIFPVANSFMQKDIPCEFYCIGPAAKLNSKYAAEYSEIEKNIKKIIQEKNVSLLVTGRSWGSTSELEMLGLCKAANVKTISILDYWSNYAKSFQKGDGMKVYPDYYLVMDEIAQREAIEEGVPQDILKIVGHPGLDKYVSYKKIEMKDKKNKKDILFLSQPLSMLYGNSLGYTEKNVLEDVIKISNKYGFKLKVKFHPKDAVDFQKKYSEITVQGNLIDIMQQYDLIIGMTTMGLLHAALMHIPVISYQPGLLKDDGCITNKLGITELVDSYQALEDTFSRLYRIEKWESKKTECSWLDGKSTERVVSLIKEVL